MAKNLKILRRCTPQDDSEYTPQDDNE